MWTVIGKIVVALLPKFISLIERQRPGAGEGLSKRAEVREWIIDSVTAVEGAAGRDVLNDPEVLRAYDAINDAIVAFQNLVAKKSAPPA